jgi:uncharacterized membrane protein
MWDLTIRNIDFYHIVNWFIIYSFLGWLWETCFVSVRKGKFINRGFINGPLCTIYGFGAVAVYLILEPISGNLLYLFLGGSVVATALEYVTAVLMESIFHTSWWDYSDKKFNFQGRICLRCSLGWGVFSVILFRVLHPVVSGFVELYPVIVGKISVCVIGVAYVVDFSFSAAAAFHLHERIPAWEQALDQIQGELLVKVRERMDALENAKGLTVDGIKERLEDIELLKELEKKRTAMMQEASAELQKRKENMALMLGHNARRFVRSYPNLNRGYRIRRERHILKKLKKDNGEKA